MRPASTVNQLAVLAKAMANQEQPERGTQPYEDEPLLRIVRVRVLKQ